VNNSTIERFSTFDSATKLKHIASNLSRLATYWEKGDREACLEIAVEARHFGEAAARCGRPEVLALLSVADTHLGLVISKLRATGDISDSIPLTRRISSAFLLLAEAVA
jgi:hypothetical protein